MGIDAATGANSSGAARSAAYREPDTSAGVGHEAFAAPLTLSRTG
jgi:hypothetical protein